MGTTVRKRFRPFLVFMKGTYKSVSEFLRVMISLDDLLVNKLRRYVGASLFVDLYTVSSFMITSIEGHCSLDSMTCETFNLIK